MSVAVKPAPPQPTAQDVNSSLAKNDSLTSAFRQLKALASSDPLQSAAEIIRQLDHQQEQMKELRKRINEQERSHTIATKVLASTIEKDKKTQIDADAEIHSLRKEIADKEKDLRDYSQKLDAAANDMKRLKSEKIQEANKAMGLSKDITSMQKALKEKDTSIDQMIALKSSFNDRLASEEKKTGDLKQECESLRAAMEDAQIKLGRLESFRAPYQEMDEDSMREQFVNLWKFATEEIFKILKHERLDDKTSWEAFRKESALMTPLPVPLPASNSKAAQGMRLVIILAILSREIDKHIFQPNYLDSDDNQLRGILSQLARTDGEKEAFCRAMLLSIDPTAQQKSVKSRTSHISRDITHRLFGSLTDDKQSEVRQTISKIVKLAIEAWMPFQHSHSKYEPDFEPEAWDDPGWQSFNFQGEKTGSSETGLTADSYLTIFPRVSCVDKDYRDPLNYVVQIRRSHPLWSEAEQEMSRSPSSPTAGRMPFTGQRRASVSTNASANGQVSPNGKASPNGKSFLNQKAV
ncbi:hypothetical protein N7494_008475 [Penicillium frequentans]|uniref:Uncharacterized protein n=1 Tax=Penicillium frequentans TaxID=3151616 RepID=A0AAD6CN38_9EURO|nr:hypothetical protein N7494_008475 [Penicillium glabrum]